jgi:hypothetical protein
MPSLMGRAALMDAVVQEVIERIDVRRRHVRVRRYLSVSNCAEGSRISR